MPLRLGCSEAPKLVVVTEKGSLHRSFPLPLAVSVGGLSQRHRQKQGWTPFDDADADTILRSVDDLDLSLNTGTLSTRLPSKLASSLSLPLF